MLDGGLIHFWPLGGPSYKLQTQHCCVGGGFAHCWGRAGGERGDGLAAIKYRPERQSRARAEGESSHFAFPIVYRKILMSAALIFKYRSVLLYSECWLMSVSVTYYHLTWYWFTTKFTVFFTVVADWSAHTLNYLTYCLTLSLKTLYGIFFWRYTVCM